MSTLVVTSRYPRSAAHGYDLRVVSLSRFIEGPTHLLVAPLGAPDVRPTTLEPDAVFASTETLPDRFVGDASARRHLRLSDAPFLRLAYPGAFAKGVAGIQAAIEQRGIRRLVVFGTGLAELARLTGFPHVLLDVCDSVALTIARQYQHDGAKLTARQHARARLNLWRAQRGEAVLPSWFNIVTTINRADSDEVARLSGGRADNVHTVPNGIGDAFLSPLADPRFKRGVAFWGNLTFAPNRAAVRHFIESVYLPWLKPAGVKVCIVGKGAEPWLLDLAGRDPQIVVKGFVDDLAQAVTEYPVMVNPMVIGSGLKNKVLEAFGLGIVVVSTSLGVEAFPDAVAGEHYLKADEPQVFADAVLQLLDDAARWSQLRDNARSLVIANYRWEVIGRRWNELCQRV